jgi:GNAT superfamily N-acetyltransferase
MHSVRPPEHLAPNHNVSEFSNGRHPVLDEWLRNRARATEGLTARTYVACPEADPARVAGYFCILAAMAQRPVLPSAKLRKSMPDEIPLLLIGRLAVDIAWQGLGLGSALLVDAVRRCLAAASIIGARAIVAHAIDETAVAFYQKHGFLLSPLGEKVMILPVETAKVLVEV